MMTAFLPCRSGSQRVPRKNIKMFGGFEHGLIEIKLRQLIDSKKIDKIILSTNDTDIIKYAETASSNKLCIHKRDDYLSRSETSTDELVAHVLELIPHGDIMWTHVTSPFISARTYDSIIEKYYYEKTRGYDSLMTVNTIHGFLWDDEEPINYDRLSEKWPRTQTLNPVNEINSAAFISNSENYRKLNDRIGRKPYLYTTDKIIGFDIDWNEDFVIAESIYINGLAEI